MTTDDDFDDNDTTAMSYHIKVDQVDGAPLTPAEKMAIEGRVWDWLYAVFQSEDAVVAAYLADEASESAAAILLWESAWEKACEAGRQGLPLGVQVVLELGVHHAC